jgi:hypothetical protein
VSTSPLAGLAEALPYPLGLKLAAIRAGARARADGLAAPELAFSVAAFSGLCLRLAALVSVQAYVRNDSGDNALNTFLVDKLRTPADGTWHEVTRRLRTRVAKDPHAARVHSWFDAPGDLGSDPPAEAPDLCTSTRVRLLLGALPNDPAERKRVLTARKGVKPLPRSKSVDEALAELVTLRNKLGHGEPPDEETLDLALLRVESIARGAKEALGGASLLVREGDKTWRIMGHVPVPVERTPEALEDGVPTLVFTDGSGLAPLPLSPLVRFKPGAAADGVVSVDELFFVNALALDRLQYVGFREGTQADGRELGTYEAFKAFWQKIPVTPSPRDPVFRYDDLASHHARLFVGRQDVLDEITKARSAAGQPGRYLELRALAGMGKTAILSMLYARHAPHPSDTMPGRALREGAASPLLPHGDVPWAFHFCAQTEGREYSLVALRSVMAQLCDAAGLDRSQWLSNDLKELREMLLPSFLAEVARRTGGAVIVLDALDESTGSDEDALAGCLPEVLPDGVTVVMSWRVDAQNQASRVDRQLARIPAASRVRLTTANPLTGLSREHVVAFLARVAALHGHAPAEAPTSTVDAVWAAATTDSPAADPFFLGFIAEGVREGRVDLDRAESVPASLEDAFEAQWLSLSTEKNFLAQRMLLLLGILREYGDDELIAEFITRDPQYGGTVSAQDVALARQGLGKLLVYDGERYGLFHDRFRRFLVGEQKDPIAEALGEV